MSLAEVGRLWHRIDRHVDLIDAGKRVQDEMLLGTDHGRLKHKPATVSLEVIRIGESFFLEPVQVHDVCIFEGGEIGAFVTRNPSFLQRVEKLR